MGPDRPARGRLGFDDEVVIIGIEIDRCLGSGHCSPQAYEVYAVNPMASARYRDRHGISGAKLDPATRRHRTEDRTPAGSPICTCSILFPHFVSEPSPGSGEASSVESGLEPMTRSCIPGGRWRAQDARSLSVRALASEGHPPVPVRISRPRH
jgi:hypothetical protein